MSGRGGRELALHLLYQMEVRGESIDQVLPEALVFFQPTPEDRAFAVRLVEYALETMNFTSDLLEKNARNWDPNRFALIDSCILRLAIAELAKVPESPMKLVINEAIELAKSYSTVKSGGFVNGVLDPIARIVRGESHPSKGEAT
ncbi:MAG: transcription antitermination factor NusB [Fibrobacterota bacterium]|nr:transcription antitermination factor NusB [Fibrobacterota bacterium]QQS04022.1 MAG: transcription antitermination factor NusB [Fibrobacterota bacterium]